MSTYVTRELPCTACGDLVATTVATSLNAGRRSEPGRAIREGTFQRVTCPWCGVRFEADLPLLWVDFEARLLVGMYPLAWMPGWQACASQLLGVYRRNLGADAPSLARPLGRDFRVWCVFGLDALREALLCADHDLDRRALEVLKWHLIRDQHLELSRMRWPALVRVEPDVLTLRGADAEEVAEFTLSREALAAITADPSPWAALLAAAGEDPFVHGLRGLLTGDAPLPPLVGADLSATERRHRTDDCEPKPGLSGTPMKRP